MKTEKITKEKKMNIALKLYREKKYPILGFFWNGKTKNEIRDIVIAIERHCGYSGYHANIATNGNLVIENKNGITSIPKNCWCIIDFCGEIEILTENIFQLKYEEI